MTTEKMTVHKALAELKTLDSRINKCINATKFVFANRHSNTKVGGVSISEYCNNITDTYKKARDLMDRRQAIKRTVVMSNAITKVTIGDMQYTVAEAIEMKNHGIELLQTMFRTLETDLRDAQTLSEKNNGEALEERANAYINNLYSNTDLKNLSEEVKKVREDFIKSQTYELIDPIDVKKEIKALEEEINSFMVDVDSALSVSNAVTEIEISY